MKKVFLITGIVLLFVLTFGLQTGKTEDQIFEKKPVIAGQRYVPDEIIVKFKPGVEKSIIANINSMNNAVAFYTSRVAGFKRLKVPYGKKVSEMVELYRKDPRVEYAEPNYIASAHLVPNDTYYSYQWHLDNPVNGGIHMEAAWDISTGSGVIVAVIDTGVAYENYDGFLRAPDLAGTFFVPGHDFVNDDTHANDDEGHGTHVTGTIAQNTDNDLGVAGVAFDCKIMPVKVLDDKGSGWHSDIADGIYFAADNGAQVINMSLGGDSPSQTLEEAVAYAYGKGVTIVASSGNDDSSTISYPAAYNDYVIAVGATRYDETLAYYSNYGAGLDIVAPGGDLYEDQNNDGDPDGVLQQTFAAGDPTDFDYWYYHGTSMAAPHVAGVAALVIASGVTVPDAVREVLQSTADDLGDNGWDETYGWGLLNAVAALTTEPDEEPPSTPTDLTATPVSGSQIDLTWTESTDNVGVTGYNIYRDGEQVGTAETTSYSDTGLQPSTTYEYRVQAFDAAENPSGLSLPANATTLDQVTGQGFILSKNPDFSTDNREFAITDTLYMKIYSEFVDYNDIRKKEYKVEDVNGQRINGPLTNHFDGTYTASVSLSALAPGVGEANLKIEDNSRTKYEVKDEVITITEALDEEPPTKPTNLTAKAESENQIDLDWDASTDNVGVTGYRIFRDGGLVGTSATTSFSDTGLEPNTTYEYKVQAFDAAGNESELSDPASETTLAPDTEPPSTPTGLTAEAVSGTQIDLTWTVSTDNVGVTGYNVYRDGSPIGTSETTSFSDTELNPSTTYEYQVQAYDAAENTSDLSLPASATTPDQVTGQGFILSKNSDFSTENREFAKTDTLYMKIYSDVVDYNDIRKKEYKIEDVNGQRINGPLTNHFDGTYTASVSLSALAPGVGEANLKIEDNSRTKYEVKDEVITIIEALDEEPPTKPTNLTATAVSENQIDLSWTASTDNVGVTSYSIFRDGGHVGASTTTSFSDTGLEPNTTYEYKVQAFDAAGNFSGLSDPTSETTLAPDTDPPTAPTDLTATAVSGTQIDLTWAASTDNVAVTGYNIFRNGSPIGTSETTSYSDTGLQPNTTYSYQVRAYDAAGNPSDPSNTASVTTPDQVTGRGFILSKNSDFSTDDRVFSRTDTLYIKIYSDVVDHNDIRKKEYKVEDVNRQRINGNLTNHFDGTYTASVSLSDLAPGAGKANIKIEDESRTKYEVKDEQITIIE